MKFTIPGVLPVTFPVSDDHVRPYKGPDDPPLEWYKTFCSMQYNITPQRFAPTGAGERPTDSTITYLLRPVAGRPVYTFHTMQEFVINAREFTVRLFTTQFVEGVAQYRVHRSPVRVHCVYRLPPSWPWQREP